MTSLGQRGKEEGRRTQNTDTSKLYWNFYGEQAEEKMYTEENGLKKSKKLRAF